MASDNIPRTTSGLNTFQQQYISKIESSPDTYGHGPQDVAELQAAQAVWSAAHAAYLKAKEAFEKAELELNGGEKGLVVVLRSSIRKVNALPNVDNAMRTSLALSAHAETRSSAGVPTTRPLGRIVDKGAHRHELQWVDNESPLSKAKPPGVDACEIFLKIGEEAPVDETTCARIARDTATPYTFEFNVADVGKTAHWLLRWVNRKDEHGPFGVVMSAKINP